MEEDLVARMLANTALTDLVSTRINWLNRPQEEGLPAVTLQVISGGRDYHMKGATGLRSPRIQVDCWGSSYLEAKAVSRALVGAIEPPDVQGATRFIASFLENETDFPPEDLAGGVTAYRVSMDWILWNSPN